MVAEVFKHLSIWFEMDRNGDRMINSDPGRSCFLSFQ
jgi:hypothetical protein